MLILSIMTVLVTFEIYNHETNHIFLFLLMHSSHNDQGRAGSQTILRQLMSVHRNVEAQVYKEGNVFKG